MLAMLQLLLSLAISPLFSLATGCAKLSAISKYRELYLEAVIVKAKLEQIQGGRFARDWAEVPYYLTEELALVTNLAYGVSAASLLISIGLFAVWWQVRAAPQTPDSGGLHAADWQSGAP
jgi:hypothetical protein